MKIFTYRYCFRSENMEEGRIGVKVVTDTIEGLTALEERLKNDSSIVGCTKEYLGEYDLEFLGSVVSLKDYSLENDKSEVK